MVNELFYKYKRDHCTRIKKELYINKHKRKK